MPPKKVPANGDELITIVGSSKQMPLAKVKDAVIFRAGEYFFRDDETNIVKVDVGNGKQGLYRRKSKLIVDTGGGKYSLRKNCIITDDGMYLDIKSGDNIKLKNGNWAKAGFCVAVENDYYLPSDPALIMCRISGEYALKENALLLSEKFYGKRAYVSGHNSHGVVYTVNGDRILNNNSVRLMDAAGSVYSIHIKDYEKVNTFTIFHTFKDTTNPQLERINTIAVSKDVFIAHCVPSNIPNLDIKVHAAHYDELQSIYNTIIVVKLAKQTEQLKKALKYSDDGPDENMAHTVQKVDQPWPGKHIIKTSTIRSDLLDRTFRLTGGLQYTFGIELETSQGVLPPDLVESTRSLMVGDRSIGAAEYVTPVLKGDKGIELVKTLCNSLALHTLVDDRTSVHVHIGNPERTLDKHFCIDAIKLGRQIEAQLYSSCPPSRTPTLKHCHSILRYDINKDNWQTMLGSYVFGPLENWQTPFSMINYKYGTGSYTKRNKVDTWCGGRYKWLNLVHILTNSKLNTCELRMFAGSTSFEKVYNYILTSMAFVWFVENRQKRVSEGNVDLFEVLTEPFIAHKRTDIADRLTKFYLDRIQRFNRPIASMYPATLPPAIF